MHISSEHIFAYTGNPFVDAGVSAITVWADKKSPEELGIEEIERLIPRIVDLYVSEGWRKVLFSVFPNNPVTNPSIKDKAEKLESYYKLLLRGVKPVGRSGSCMACGKRDADRLVTKTEVPLTGSGNLKNFFSYASEGADYCSTCTLAIQFSPLVFYACRNLILLHSNSSRLMRKWALECKRHVNLSGCFNEGYTKPRNSFFRIAEGLTAEHDEKWEEEKIFLRIYYFTNYNQGPALEIFDLPENVFRFINTVRRSGLYSEWRRIVRKGYRAGKKAEITEENEEEYKNSDNEIYKRLLERQSITGYFIDIQNRAACCGQRLFELYLSEVRNMDKARIELIRRIADDISDAIRETDRVQRIGDIERANKYGDFLRFLIIIIKARHALKKETPLVTFDELTGLLFPDGWKDWREVKLVMLFRIYENLHDWIIGKKSPEEIENDIEDIIKSKEAEP